MYNIYIYTYQYIVYNWYLQATSWPAVSLRQWHGSDRDLVGTGPGASHGDTGESWLHPSHGQYGLCTG